MDRNIHDPIENIDDDCLGRHIFARTILRRIANDGCLPTVGLFGDWGTGKSSLLRMLVELNKDPNNDHGGKFHIVIFDAWLYESTSNLFIPIMVWLSKSLKGKGKRIIKWKTAMKKVLLATSLTAGDAVLRYAGVRQLIPGELGDVKKDFMDNLEDIEDDFTPQRWERLVDDIEQARTDFQKVIKMALEGETYKRLVFCIDNLDRCSPENGVHLLESIKNYLSVEGVVWVIAVDPHVIYAYIENQYGTQAIGGYNYLDKIFPEQYHIPPLSIRSDSISIEKLLDRALGDVSVTSRPSDWKRYAQIPRILVPRRLVKSARKLAEIYRLPTHRGTAATADTVFALILLYFGWPEFYERLSSDQVDHVKGVLSNFVEDINGIRDDEERKNLPLPTRFIEDRDLKYYLTQAFLTQGYLDDISADLASAMHWLQQVGLP